MSRDVTINGVVMRVPQRNEPLLRDGPRPTLNGIPLSPLSFTLMTMDADLLLTARRLSHRGAWGQDPPWATIPKSTPDALGGASAVATPAADTSVASLNG